MTRDSSSGLSRRRFAQLVAAGALGWSTMSRATPTYRLSAAFTQLRDRPVSIGCFVFDRMDQIDLTGPFSVLSRLPDSTVTLLSLTSGVVRDHKGFLITPQATLTVASRFDVLMIPGGPGQEALMEDATLLSAIRAQDERRRPIFSVCTGALLCGAAGVLQGRRATTHWSALDLLPSFGAEPQRERVVVDEHLVTAAGVTAGIDGALVVAALLRGDTVAQQIQLDIQYAPDPPFDAGSPESAPPDVLAEVRKRYAPLTLARRATAERLRGR